MAKDLVLEEYEDYDDYDLYDHSEDSYDNYSYEDNEYEDDYEEIEEKRFNPGSALSIIALISTWFIRIGVVMGLCLLIVFFVMGKIATVFLYVLGLIVAFLFGYGFMFCLDRFILKEN